MRSLTLAYRDDDRTPVIFAIRAMAARHYETDEGGNCAVTPAKAGVQSPRKAWIPASAGMT